MDKRTILAFVLSFLVLFAWSYFFVPQGKPPQKKQAAQTEAPQEAAPPPEATPATPAAPPPQAQQAAPKVGEKEIVVETPLYRAVLSNVGPALKSFKLKKYHETVKRTSPLVELATLPQGRGDFFVVNFTRSSAPPSADMVFSANKENIALGPDSPPEDLIFRSVDPEGVLHTQIFRFYPNRYGIDLTSAVVNNAKEPISGAFTTHLRAQPPQKKGYYSYVGLAALANNKMEEVKIEKPSEEKVITGQISWAAYEDDYFISAAAPEQSKGTFTGVLSDAGILQGTYRTPSVSLRPSEQASSHFSLYFGPRDIGALNRFGHNLDEAVSFGWTNIIAKPLLYLLQFFDRFTHNYGIAIILLTVLVKIIFWPLTHKSYKSMKEMQKLQPRMAKIREKYKGNKEQMNKEMMALYRTYKVNPMSGCLPMIIQIPVFFALFRILGSAIELRHAPFFLWINDLSAPDRLGHFSTAIPFMSPPYGIPVLTLLMGASMFLQQKMTPTAGDPTQAKVMMFLPVIFTFMFINFPSGLVLYWLVNNLLSIAQQYRIQKSSA